MKRIGIIGGGQLGKMMILDGRRLDYGFYILDPAFNCPAHNLADMHIVAEFDDIEAIKRLASMTDVVTYELEHISVEALKAVEEMNIPVYPSSRTLSLIQDKFIQKEWLKKHDIPTAEFIKVDGIKEIHSAAMYFGYPMLLKTRTGGYDGKGNYVISAPEDIEKAYEALGSGKLELMAERFVKFTKEVSVLACRSINGETSVFPVAENLHRNNILDETIVPAKISSHLTKEAMNIAEKCLEAFEACGMLCVEMFVTDDDRVVVNELAPRPHNSGHYTIEGCYTSQFEQHLRAILGFPLGDASLIRPTAMKNIIGDHEGHAVVHGLKEAYALPHVKIHIYGKNDIRPGRKMGHITASADTVEEALQQVRAAHKAIFFTDNE